MNHGKRASALAWLLVGSLLAGGLAGVASADPASASASLAGSSAVVVTGGDAVTLQSAADDNESGSNTTIHHEGDGVTLTSSAGETITGETGFPPGTALTIMVTSEDDQAPFIESTDVTVDENGTFSGTVDLSKLPANVPISVVVKRNHWKITEVEGTIVRCVENCSGPDEWPTFDPTVVGGKTGAPVAIPIDVPQDHDGPVNVTVGDEDSKFILDASIEDANDDGEIVLTLDTERAGNGSPSEYLSANDDRIVAAYQRSEDVSPPLDSGFYSLAIGPSDAPYDVGTLSLDEHGSGAGEDPGSNQREDAPEISVNTTGEVTFITAGDTLELGNAENRTIRAETELAPGSNVRFRLESSEASNPFLLTPETTVSEHGTINATVDLSEVAPGTPFKLIAIHDDEAVGATAGRVVECSDGCAQRSNGASQSAAVDGSKADSSDGKSAENESNVVEVNDSGGSIPLEGLAAIGIGGVLAVAGLVRFTGALGR